MNCSVNFEHVQFWCLIWVKQCVTNPAIIKSSILKFFIFSCFFFTFSIYLSFHPDLSFIQYTLFPIKILTVHMFITFIPEKESILALWYFPYYFCLIIMVHALFSVLCVHAYVHNVFNQCIVLPNVTYMHVNVMYIYIYIFKNGCFWASAAF